MVTLTTVKCHVRNVLSCTYVHDCTRKVLQYMQYTVEVEGFYLTEIGSKGMFVIAAGFYL